jgi:hypothetical protein
LLWDNQRKEEMRMTKGKRMSRHRRGVLVAVLAILAGSVVRAQDTPRVKVLVNITEDDGPCLGAKVVIRPKGEVEGWPKGKTQIVLETGLDGRTYTTLGAGKYRITAVDSIQNKLPADAYFTVKPGQVTPMKIRLNLLYWDCAHVTCEL